MSNRDVILVGGGGNCKVILELLKETDYNPIGLLEPSMKVGETFFGVECLGSDDEAPRLLAEGVQQAIITPAMPCTLKRRLTELYLGIGFTIPTLVSSSAIISSSASIGEGTCVFPGANIGPDVRIGRHCTVNVSAVITHGVTIGDYSNIAPNSTILGFNEIGAGTLIGAGGVIIQCHAIGTNSIVGAGSVVTHDVADNEVVVGNPARHMRFQRGIDE